ncbi:MAG: cupin domain-containing protein [Pseudomonadota bacterium]
MASPTLAYWHVWTDDEGITHQTKCELTNFVLQSMGGKAAEQWNAQIGAAQSNLMFCNLPVGWIGDWHENPKPQWIIPLKGRWFVETMDGVRVEMGPGDISFGADQHSKPDGQGRFGHLSGTVGDEAASLMLVQLEEPSFIAARPGIFK